MTPILISDPILISRVSALRFKKVRDAYSVRIGTTGYRAVAVDVSDGFLWIWIGSHDEYERLLRK